MCGRFMFVFDTNLSGLCAGTARGAPYAKARTHLSHDIQMARHHNHGHARTAAENGPSLLS